MQNLTFIPVVQIRPNGLLCYYEVDGMRLRSASQIAAVPPTATYTGSLNAKSIVKLKKAIRILVASAKPKTAFSLKTGQPFKWKINFITLTLPAPQGKRTDSEIKKYCLEPFMRICRNKFGMVSYVWKAERQKNGNLHFHITADTWIHYLKVQRHWNKCLEKLNFITQFEKRHGHRNPNSTDIHAVHQVRNLAAYMVKYMAKTSTEKDVIQGKVWDCSTNLKKAKYPSLIIEGNTRSAVDLAFTTMNNKTMDFDFAELAIMSSFQLNRSCSPYMKQVYREWLASIGTN